MYNGNPGTGIKNDRCEINFRELLSSRLASLEQELVAAHVRILASERSMAVTPFAPQHEPQQESEDVSAIETVGSIVASTDSSHRKPDDSSNKALTSPAEAWGTKLQTFTKQCATPNGLGLQKKPSPSDAWGLASETSSRTRHSAPPNGVFCQPSQVSRTDDSKHGSVVKFTDVMPEPLWEDEMVPRSPDLSETSFTVIGDFGDVTREESSCDLADSESPGQRVYHRASEVVRIEKASYVVRSGQFELLGSWRAAQTLRKKHGLTRAGATGATRFGNLNRLSRDTAPEDSPEKIMARAHSDRYDIDQPLTIEGEGCLKHWLLMPSSTKRASWDILSLFLVSYDVIVLPLGFFKLPDSIFFTIMTWTTRLFWTCDIPMSVLTGYLRRDGTTEMRPRKILERYLYTWFALDMVIVLTDWFELIASGLGFIRITKASRIFRIIRMIRLLRMAKIQQILGLLIERQQSEMIHTVAEMAQIMCVLLVIAHMIACSWWAIGDQEGEDNWVVDQKAREMSFATQYALSFHWSISQFTGGMDEIRAINTNERYFVVGVFLFCFILASLFLGSLTSSMTQLQFITNKHARQVQKLRRFLYQSNISGRTALRIQMNAQHAVSERQRLMPEDDVELLKVVSEPLRYELHFEMYSEIFDSHVFFTRYKEECPAVVRKMCNYACFVTLVSRGDLIFSIGELPDDPKTYIFFEGRMKYVSARGVTTDLNLEQWIAEAALWTTWRHQGVLTALADCRLYTLDAKKLSSIVLQFEHITFDPRRYALAFVNDLNKLQPNELSDLTFHLVAPGAEKSALKPSTEVFDLCKDEYNMRITRGALVHDAVDFIRERS